MQMTEEMDTEEIIKFAESRPEPVWHWGDRLRSRDLKQRGMYQKIVNVAEELNLELLWDQPIRPGDLYLAGKNTGPHLLTCLKLGDAMVIPEGIAYVYDFNCCVLVREKV